MKAEPEFAAVAGPILEDMPDLDADTGEVSRARNQRDGRPQVIADYLHGGGVLVY